MRLTHLALLAATPALIVGMTACGNSSDSAKSTTTTAAPTTSKSAPATATKLIGPSSAPLPAPSPTHPPAPAPQPLTDIDCGPVTGANGQSANVIAYATKAGRIGCTEAVNVASEYVSATRTGDAVQVAGWTCEPQPDTTIPRICFKDDFRIGLRGNAGPVDPPPVITTTPPVPTPDPTVDDVNCGPVTDAGGGTRHVIAVGTAAGRVGCTEAINVATEYVQTISDTDVATIDGWSCNAQPDTDVPSMCAKDGLVIALRAS